MARSNTGSTSNWFSHAAALKTNVPLTFAAWLKTPNITTSYDIVYMGDAAAGNYFMLGISTTSKVTAVVAPGDRTAFSTASIVADTWFHAAATFTNNTQRNAILNGVFGSAETNSATPSGVDRTHVGAYDSGAARFGAFNGSIAELGIWNTNLLTIDILMLSKGVSPLMVKPNNLLAYYPMHGIAGVAIDRIGKFDLTENGTMAIAEHTRQFYPTGPILILPYATGGASQQIDGALYGEADTFFTNVVTVGAATITGVLFAEADSFFVSTITTGSVTITGALFTDADTFFTNVITQIGPTQNITGVLFTDADVFFTSVVVAGSVTISGALFTDSDTFFTSVITTGAVLVTGVLFADTDTFFNNVISQSSVSQNITGALFTDTDTFFTAVVLVGVVTINGALFTDADGFFTSTITTGATTINGNLFTDADIFFGATLFDSGAPPSGFGKNWISDEGFFDTV